MDKVLQKDIAIKCLEKLDIYKPYITKFKSKATLPCFYENFAGFWADQEPELYTKVKEVEEESGRLVYAITHELTDFGECWSMLYVPSECEDIDELIMDTGRSDVFYVLAYTWNKSNPMFSEAGDIAVRSFGGGIKRIF